ncbi:Uncharacterised protein [Klebsiella pneumoniae]|uniref:Uncharacterized protein n=1 Tax=Klebsiella pneumoniae TaxID=573 RepID=A0A2X1QIQ2_KLEPN|nr:Uncharacterised protein [Klebsiella pneumoniae]
MMEKEQNQCCQQPLLHQDVSPTTSRVTFSTDKKVLTAEQYRDWQYMAQPSAIKSADTLNKYDWRQHVEELCVCENVDTYSRYDPEVSTSGIDTGYIRRLSGM